MGMVWQKATSYGTQVAAPLALCLILFLHDVSFFSFFLEKKKGGERGVNMC